MAESEYGPGVHHFRGAAMAAPFEIIIAGEDKKYAGEAAQAAYAEIDQIEQRLSRYIDSSDISRVNAKGAIEPILVSLETMTCLRVAQSVNTATGGAFDITVRKPKLEDKELPVIGMQYIELDEENFTVRLKRPGVRLDLGGIGKGFGIDRALVILGDWGINNVMLSAGDSTILAKGAPPGKPGWPVTIGGDQPEKRKPIERILKNRALSGSGTRVQGRHIIDPKTGRPARGPIRSWASCPTGTLADALSTAFMVMPPEATKRYCEAHPNTWAVVLKSERDQFMTFGAGF